MAVSEVPAVVIGGGVAGLAAAWELGARGVSATVLERAPRLGGLVESERTPEGALLEHGADGLLADKVGGFEVLAALGLDEAIVRGGRAPKRAFVTDGDALVEMPGGLFAFERRAMWTMMTSPLLSVGTKLGLLVEPLRGRPPADDETVSSFFSRRMGDEVARKLVAPMVQGVFGAAATDVGVRSVFPKLAAMERQYGSLGIALLIAKRAPRGHGLVTLGGGMESLPRALAEGGRARGARIETGKDVARLGQQGSMVRVELTDGSVLHTSRVILATGVSRAAELVAPLVPAAADVLGAIRSSDAEVVSFVVPRAAIDHPLDGSGVVVAEDPARPRRTLACTFASEKWHGRAPEGTVVLRSVLRGAPELESDDLIAAAREELRVLIGLRAADGTTRVRRRRGALPVYAVAHQERVLRLNGALADDPRISVCGNYLRGVGVPDSVATGLEAARRAAPPA
ncbi:MAG: protoporphyrinogen oxidase [Sandaracinus sp.]